MGLCFGRGTEAELKTGRIHGLAFVALGGLALFLAAGCSSRNPDSLIGMNVDENLAVMDENQGADANASALSDSGASAAPAENSTKAAEVANRTAQANSAAREPPADVETANTIEENEIGNETDQNRTQQPPAD